MKAILMALMLIVSTATNAQVQNKFNAKAISNLPPAHVSFEDFETLSVEAKKHRSTRLITAMEFLKMSKDSGVIILDTRSDIMYRNKHLKGAVHLNFSDFTQANLAKVIPTYATKILIYCNNNIGDDPINFASKSIIPQIALGKMKPLTLALNIPTYINLFGYGYKNVFELSELIPSFGSIMEFEGISVRKIK
jgi:Rhodanese-like domain